MEGGIDTCGNDSGGPLAWLDPETNEVKLVGVTSWGLECAAPGQVGVYAKISAVVDWINKETGGCNEQTCKEGNCMNWEDLVEDARQSFKAVTPHKKQSS